MKMTRLKMMLIGLGVIVLSNALALMGVAHNRSAESEALLELTERELALPYRYISKEENTGLALKLKWRLSYQIGYRNSAPDSWLTNEKLRALGFDIPVSISSEERKDYQNILPRAVFLLLEYDGARYQHALDYLEKRLADEQALAMASPDNEEFVKRVARAQQAFNRERTESSRLFVIDAGLDAEALRQQYADRSRYMVLKGKVGVSTRREGDQYLFSGYVSDVLIDNINVPLAFRSTFESLDSASYGRNATHKPRYFVTLKVGKRLEPWITEVGSL